jgi:histone deacetylase 11
MARVVYDRRYDIRAFGLERLHPFDTHKHSHAWQLLEERCPELIRGAWIRPTREISRDELLQVHSAEYLDQLRDAKYLAGALEVPAVRRLPWRLVDWFVLRPMRWATMGTILAARAAMQFGAAGNLAGGYHHAKPESGEGFCIYADIALAIDVLRRENLLKEHDRIAYIDLDAHQGNGVCHAFLHDSRVFIFDIYNRGIYPWHDVTARERIDCAVPVAGGCDDAHYLGLLRERLPGFLESVARKGSLALAIFNAGTDPFRGDPLGGLELTAGAIEQRDRFVINCARDRGVPLLMLPSGGYSGLSYRMLADSVEFLLAREP